VIATATHSSIPRGSVPPEIRLYLSGLLNQTLACTVDLRSQVKQASWDVEGENFSQLQALFTTIATALDAYADLMAERMVVLGGMAVTTELSSRFSYS